MKKCSLAILGIIFSASILFAHRGEFGGPGGGSSGSGGAGGSSANQEFIPPPFKVTIEGKSASTNRVKYGFTELIHECLPIIKIYKERLETSNITTFYSHEECDGSGEWSYTDKMDKSFKLVRGNNIVITGCTGTVDTITQDYSEVWSHDETTIWGYGGSYSTNCTISYDQSGNIISESEPGCSWIIAPGLWNPSTNTSPPVTSALSISSAEGNFHTVTCTTNEFEDEYIQIGTSSSFEKIELLEEFKTAELLSTAGLDLEGVSWGGRAAATVSVGATELCGDVSKAKWRLLFTAPLGQPYKFHVIKVTTVGTNTVKEPILVEGIGTGLPTYYPSSAGETLEPVIATEAFGNCEKTLNTSVSVDLPEGCDSCSVCNRPGATDNANESVDVTIALGAGWDKGSAGDLRIKSRLPDAELASPAHLFYFGNHESVDIIPSSGALRQVKAPLALADIVIINSNKYEVRFYSDPGELDDGLYFPNGSPFSTTTIEHVLSTNHLRVTFSGDTTEVADYTWDDVDQGWTLITGGGLRKEVRAWNPTTLTETHSILNADDSIAFQETTSFYQLPSIGLALKERVTDPTGAVLTNKWFYYDDELSDGTNYGKLRMITEPSGFWRKFNYGTNGLLQQQVEQFLNAGTNAADESCRVFEFTYNIDTNAIYSKCVVEKLLGIEVSRRYFMSFPEEHLSIECQTPGAAWDAANNLVTRTRHFGSGDFVGEVESVVYPNGTMMIARYLKSGGQTFKTNFVGQPNTGGTAIINGREIVSVTGSIGEMISKTVTDIASGKTLESEICNDHDEFGQPEQISYLDGTSSSTVHACCGVQSRTDRTGTVTSYTYDDLKRVLTTTVGGITVSNLYDAAHNVLSRVRIGTDNSEIVMEGADLDVALRSIYQTNALLHVTTNRYGYNGYGETVTTNLFPDSGIQITTSAQDGLLLSVTGSAVHPVRYEYGIEFAGTNSSGVNVTNFYTKEIKLETNGTDTGEWTKSYVDMLGRTWKTAYANGGIEYSFYNNQGQLVKTIDPDGVIKLFAYNDSGELEFSAVDLNQDGEMSLFVDRVTKTVHDVTAAHSYDVLRTRNYVYPIDSDDTPLLVSTVETSADGLRQWFTSHGLTERVETSYYGYGQKTITRHAADDSFVLTEYLDGRVTAVKHSDSVSTLLQQTTYAYDEHGRRETVTDARNGATTYTFSNADQVLTVTTPVPGSGLSAQTTTYEYDERGRVEKTIQPGSGEVFNEYYLCGELKKTYGSRTYPVEYTYDSQGRMKTMTTWQNFSTSQGAAVTTWNYDAERGFLTSKLYADSNGTTYTNSLAGRLLSRTWARDITTSYGYNEAGDLETVDYSDTTADVTYGNDRLGRKTYAVQGATSLEFRYNDAGRLLSETYIGGPLDGVVVTNTFDELLRRTNLMAQFSSTPFLNHSYAYGEASRLSIVNDGSNSATYGYLANSPLVETITFKQNSTERMLSEKVYDNLNRLTSIIHSTNSVALAEYAYDYNDANQRVRVDEMDDSYWFYEYDPLGQVKSGKKYWSDGTPVAGQQFVYSHDDIGNRKHAAAGGNEWGTGLSYAHYYVNSLNQYTSRTVPGAVDVIGTANASSTVTVNNQSTYRKGEYFWGKLSIGNQSSPIYQSITNLAVLNDSPDPDITTNSTGHVLLPKTPETFLHDTDGNLIRDGLWTNIWNGENRLVRTESLSTVPEAARARVDWTHLPDGRWIERIVSTWMSGVYVPQSTNRYVWDGQVLFAILDENNEPVLSFVRGLDLSGTLQGAGGVGGLLAVTDHSASESHFVGNDGNGNVTLLVAAAGGIESARYAYSPFGETLRATGEMAERNPMRFSTQLADEVTGDAKYLFREYRPIKGRWLSRDPIEESGHNKLSVKVSPESDEKLALYAFVSNDPLGKVDYLGLAAVPCSAAPPLTKNDSACEKYGDGKYLGASLKCFCKCAPDDNWSKMVRGCLRCMADRGFPTHQSHLYCYEAADQKYKKPTKALAKCLAKCQVCPQTVPDYPPFW